MSTLPLWFLVPWLFLLGACFGSFIGMLAYRLPRGLPWVSLKGRTARSACPHCGHVLGISELIPILSWVLLKGRCKNCDQRISIRYTLIELFFGFIVLFGGLIILR